MRGRRFGCVSPPSSTISASPSGRGDHAAVGATLANGILRRLRYPNDLRERVVRIVQHHVFLLGDGDAAEARRMLARYGDGLTFDLLDHWHADLRGRDLTESVAQRLERLAVFRETVELELGSPHRLADLAVDGADLIGIGFEPGPAIGKALETLLDEVVDQPALNKRAMLLERAEQLLHA